MSQSFTFGYKKAPALFEQATGLAYLLSFGGIFVCSLV